MINTLKNVTIWTLLIILLAGGLYVYFVILPQQEFSRSQEQTADNTEEIERLEIEVNELKRDLNELRQQVGQPRVEEPSPSPNVTEPVPREATRAAEEQRQQEEEEEQRSLKEAYDTCFAELTEDATDPDEFRAALDACQEETGYNSQNE